MWFPKTTACFKFSRWDAISIIFHYTTSTFEVHRDKGRTSAGIQRIFDQFQNDSIEVRN